jgi:hypothetical protein
MGEVPACTALVDGDVPDPTRWEPGVLAVFELSAFPCVAFA